MKSFLYNFDRIIVDEFFNIGKNVYNHSVKNGIEIFKESDIMDYFYTNIKNFIENSQIRSMVDMIKDNNENNNTFKSRMLDALKCGIVCGFNSAFYNNFYKT